MQNIIWEISHEELLNTYQEELLLKSGVITGENPEEMPRESQEDTRKKIRENSWRKNRR